MPLAEKQLIERIRRLVPHVRAVPFGANVGKRAVRLGIGDDCAVLALPAGHEALVTTDLSIEGVHFRQKWHPPESVGHRCLARGLSDLAAMGGEPVAAWVSLALPGSLPQKWVGGFYKGLLALAKKSGVELAGGDTAESPQGIVADIVVVGHVPAGKAVRRSGARAGDSIYVTGELGRSAAILHQLEGGKDIGSPRAKAVAAHFFPVPRLAVGLELRRRGLASAMIDLSDGLSTDLAHICGENGVGALVAEHSIPRPSTPGTSTLHFALHGGEDYELLFTVPGLRTLPPNIAGVRVTRIGEIIRGRRMWLTDSHGQRKPLGPGGWEHFGKR
ncbi:MAG: thiamine-phosphate kinase [Acidobacteria bacterium]|nr:thiamine-phosphate kinase [Acidobacteriota bacterium]